MEQVFWTSLQTEPGLHEDLWSRCYKCTAAPAASLNETSFWRLSSQSTSLTHCSFPKE